MVWHNLRMYIHESHSYRVTRTRVTHTPPGPPPGALRRAPGPHPKSARAYALAMCAPRTCLPPQKNRLALTRSLCALRAHVCPKKIGPQQFKKIGSRFALAMCATRTCLPPHNQSLPPSCPPTFKILVPPLLRTRHYNSRGDASVRAGPQILAPAAVRTCVSPGPPGRDGRSGRFRTGYIRGLL